MAVSTIASAYGNTGGINEESQKVINRLNGHKTAEEMIGEYFGLRKEVIYSDDGKEVVDMVNEFRDPAVLKAKKVRFVPYFESKGMTRDMFDKAIPKQYQPEEPVTVKEDVRPEAYSDPIGDGVAQSEPAVPTPRKGTRKPKE